MNAIEYANMISGLNKRPDKLTGVNILKRYAPVFKEKYKDKNGKTVIKRWRGMIQPAAFDYDISVAIPFSEGGLTGYISVGIIDDKGSPDFNREHVNWDGESFTYRDLFKELNRNGYDPLLPIRQPEYIKEIVVHRARKAAEAYRKDVIAGRKSSPMFRLSSLKNKVLRDVIGYLASSYKPPLEQSTIKNREWRSVQNPNLYKKGLRVPLWESGTLADDIDAVVILTGNDVKDIVFAEIVEGERGRITSLFGSKRTEFINMSKTGSKHKWARALIRNLGEGPSRPNGKTHLETLKKLAWRKLWGELAAQEIKALISEEQKEAIINPTIAKEYAASVSKIVSSFGILEQIGSITIKRDVPTLTGLPFEDLQVTPIY